MSRPCISCLRMLGIGIFCPLHCGTPSWHHFLVARVRSSDFQAGVTIITVCYHGATLLSRCEICMRDGPTPNRTQCILASRALSKPRGSAQPENTPAIFLPSARLTLDSTSTHSTTADDLRRLSCANSSGSWVNGSSNASSGLRTMPK
ncbi:hypothetical protein BD310DRAFT_936614 [Dichomitus squalens]|uniref:Secreted protein n=1 Tax=Dichomitus squalens TaxID=114155 RepID=A0A4Q9PJ81_9APHY|nr:hypothetical protein BD310DRAFT_936614 [Dichomitus squalens]